MNWPDALFFIAFMSLLVFAACVYELGRWPWDRK